MDFIIKLIFILIWNSVTIDCSVVSPPWIDSTLNPCAAKPNGWQLLYWPKDGQCYRIFQKGYPCPDSMELTPGKNGTAECNCPPGTALNPRDAICYKLHKQGPCKDNEYFGPVKTQNKSFQGHRWGACFEIEECENDKVFWAKEGKCYEMLTKGPCPEGLLLQENDKFGECSCDNNSMPLHYWDPGLSCHEHFQQGPCDLGKIFLPNGKCGCDQAMKEYYPENKMCYAIGSQGPCKGGHIYRTKVKINGNKEEIHGECLCREGYVLWKANGICYHPYTRGPCNNGEILEANFINNEQAISCVALPCEVGHLYFPGGKGCHKVGTQGPCPFGQVVLFQNVNHGKDEILYLGTCGCKNYQEDESSFYPQLRSDSEITTDKCQANRNLQNEHTLPKSTELASLGNLCGSGRGFVLWKDQSCWQLYLQGPCKDGEWLVPDRGKGQRKGRGWRIGKCECRPGYTNGLNGNSVICVFNNETVVKFSSGKA